MVIVSLCACSAHGSDPAPVPVWKDTIYQFSEQPAGLDRSISGTVRVIGRSAFVDAQPGPCRSVNRPDESRSTYQCADVLLTVDMSTSVLRLRFSTTTTVREYKSTCVRYETNAQGQRVCAQTQTEPVERQVGVSGLLRLTPEVTKN